MANKQIFELTDIGTLANSNVFPIQVGDGSSEAKKASISELKDFILPVVAKEWVGYVSQSGTSAPTIVSTVKNDFSGTISFGYTSPGVFTLNDSSAEFTSGKTIVQMTNGLNQTGNMGYAYQSTTLITLVSRDVSGTTANSLMASTMVKVTVYP